VTDRLVLDTGALIALERNDRRMWARLAAAADASLDVVVPAGALAQMWRGTANQARLGQALKNTRVGEFDAIARLAGELCHVSRTSNPIDAAVVLNASGTTSVIATSDPTDIRRVIRSLPADTASRIAILRI
jgi:rRNA-processing protein FCF1